MPEQKTCYTFELDEGQQEKFLGLIAGGCYRPRKVPYALAAAEEAGELKLRLTGQYNTFDFAASGAQLASLSKIGQLAQQIRG